MKKILLLALGISFVLSACGGMVFAAAPTPTSTGTSTPLPPTETATVTPTSTITPTFTASPIPTATWVKQGPDAIQVPILMYHHVEINPIRSDYRVSATKFEDELRLLYNWGYTTITTDMLIKAITQGADLPPRPIIITFDDGNLDNYTVAWPIMKKYGFTGVLYIVGNYMGTDGYMNADQIKEMAAAGWEVGSHTMSHIDLTTIDPEMQRYQIVESRNLLQKELGVPIMTFSYPFGRETAGVVDYVHFAGYTAGMGATGFTADQGISNLFVLQRVEIKGSEDAKTFIRFLPWHGDPAFLPTDTPTVTPTSSRTPIPTYTMYPTSTTAP